MFKTKSRRVFIVEESDVTLVLAGINRQHKAAPSLRVGHCGWADEPTKWFVMFDANDKVYGNVVKNLKTIGKFKLEVRPGGIVDIYFERDV